MKRLNDFKHAFGRNTHGEGSLLAVGAIIAIIIATAFAS